MDALGEGQHGSGGLGILRPGEGRHHGGGRLDNRGSWGLDRGEIAVGELSDAALSGLQLFLEFLVFHLQGVDGGDYLVKELIDLVLVVSLAELDVLELLVEDILSSEQGHCFASRSFRLTSGKPHAWTTGKAARYHVTKRITDMVTRTTFNTARVSHICEHSCPNKIPIG